MKVLFVATVRSHIGQFHMPFIKCLVQNGHTVHAAFKDNSFDKKGLALDGISETFEVPFERNPFRFNNIKAYFCLKKIIRNGNYDIVHCHTPMGAVITRLACIGIRKKGTKVFYTAHGFHFYKGASKKAWLIYYPVEKLLAKFTDCLILINNEDYDLATSKKFRAERIVKINGVGIDIDKFKPELMQSKSELRRQYGYDENSFILIYPADLSVRKNQTMLLKAVALLKERIPDLKLLLPGQPILLNEYSSLCKELGITDNVDFLGYRRDIPQLVALSDVSVSSSRQEGLPINIIEAMAMGKPIVVTNVRGNADLIENNLGGFTVPLNDAEAMANAIIKLYKNTDLQIKMGKYNIDRAQEYSCDKIIDKLMRIYNIPNGNCGCN